MIFYIQNGGGQFYIIEFTVTSSLFHTTEEQTVGLHVTFGQILNWWQQPWTCADWQALWFYWYWALGDSHYTKWPDSPSVTAYFMSLDRQWWKLVVWIIKTNGEQGQYHVSVCQSPSIYWSITYLCSMEEGVCKKECTVYHFSINITMCSSNIAGRAM